jgi:hypothetical protein
VQSARDPAEGRRPQTTDHRPEAGDLRHETIDHRPAEGEVLRSEVPESNVYGLKSKVSSPDVQGLKSKVSLPCEAERASCEVPGVSREKFPATNQEPSTTHNALVIKHQAPSTDFPSTTNQEPRTKHQELFSPSDSGFRSPVSSLSLWGGNNLAYRLGYW